MNTSEFNSADLFLSHDEQEIELPISSVRYRYFQTRKYGLLQFLKRVAPEYEGDLQTMAALRKEFYICFPLSHPNIVRYTRLEPNAIYSEYIEGATLKQLKERDDRRLLDPGFVKSIIRQLFEALEYIHSQGVRHLDLKPENIMVTDKGNILKVIDFGCAESTVHDTTGGFTAEFKAPEQGGGDTDFTTDIYLGAKVAQLLAENAGLGRKWHRVLKKAAAENPDFRYASARRVLEELPQEKEARSPYIMITLAAILLAVVAIGVSLYQYFRYEHLLSVSSPVKKEVEGVDSLSNLTDFKESKTESAENGDVTGQTFKNDKERKDHTNDVVVNPEDTKIKSVNKETQDKKTANSGNLSRQIESHIKANYKRVLGAVVDDKNRFPDGRNSPGGDAAFRNALQQVQREALSYGRELSQKNPQQKDEIDDRVNRTITSLNLQYMSRFNMY